MKTLRKHVVVSSKIQSDENRHTRNIISLYNTERRSAKLKFLAGSHHSVLSAEQNVAKYSSPDYLSTIKKTWSKSMIENK